MAAARANAVADDLCDVRANDAHHGLRGALARNGQRILIIETRKKKEAPRSCSTPRTAWTDVRHICAMATVGGPLVSYNGNPCVTWTRQECQTMNQPAVL